MFALHVRNWAGAITLHKLVRECKWRLWRFAPRQAPSFTMLNIYAYDSCVI